MSTVGISNSGNFAEILFCNLTGAKKSNLRNLGDVTIGEEYLEIKCVTSYTINQVRAIKYIPLVVYNSRTNCWYVVPPNEIVKLVGAKSRGQHGENPYECSVLNLQKLNKFKVERVNLKERCILAILEGNKYPMVREEMCRILEETKLLVVNAKKRVQELYE